MHYKVTSRREEAVTVDGLGVLPPATREDDDLFPSVSFFDEQAAGLFAFQRGITLVSASMPKDVEVTVVVEEE